MNNFLKMIENWKTTALGIIPLVFALLVGLGIVDVSPEAVTDSVGTVFDTTIAFLSSILGLIGLFSKDGDK